MLERACALCGAVASAELGLCTPCHQSLPTLGPSCPRCSTPLSGNLACGRCQASPPPYSRSLAPFDYAYPINILLKSGKFAGRLDYLDILGWLMARQLERQLKTRPQCIIPVPLHSLRLFARGYNQALELSRPVSKHLEIPLLTDSCKRIRYTAPQAQLPAAIRRTHLAGAFAVREPLPFSHAAVLDDVLTTGSTASALTSTLLAAGVLEVEVWALARAGSR